MKPIYVNHTETVSTCRMTSKRTMKFRHSVVRREYIIFTTVIHIEMAVFDHFWSPSDGGAEPPSTTGSWTARGYISSRLKVGVSRGGGGPDASADAADQGMTFRSVRSEEKSLEINESYVKAQ